MLGVNINLVTVLFAAIVNMVLGMVWYGPLFGKTWMKLIGISEKSMEEMKKKGVEKSYALAFFGSLITAFVLATLIDIAQARNANEGIQLGFLAWLGFVATTSLSSVLWEGKSPKLYWLNNTYNLTSLIIMGVILTVWS